VYHRAGDFDQINEYIERLKAGDVVGRAVVNF
jgi:hypothetical protein